ncbi:hypothetical protein CFC21_040967 [Triticum aestivum]|uniref:Uncharacterized protein n=2 Tax=Triticum aestivum TaxID=4565 RepID=A0A9R1JTN0_WHEAT|nr:BTB/POZ and MATH domain-containing protein 3-like [Triticum aestivum]KAF7029150.1 hypothetical protein CFC21_040963 [Triticum aestivum]KAF7029154.1 hypothetical protein CFC21_040967 [Triticum aestivum]
MKTCTIVGRVQAKGHHFVRIDGYSHTKAMMATGDHVLSCGFPIGGRIWRVKYYPNGSAKEHADWISVSLLVDPDTKAAAVKARFRFSLLDTGGEPVPEYVTSSSEIRTFPSPGPKAGGWAFPRFVKRLDLENSAHLKDDGFAIRCDVDVMSDLGLHVEETFLDVPEPDLRVHLARLLRTKDGADVAFKVGDETFGAHRCMLAARSPVFKAEISGHKADTCVNIDGMDAPAFQALLHFIYTDSLPDMAGQDVPAVVRQLSAAADRYQVARLKLVCEDKLNKTTATVDQRQRHHRHRWFMGTCLEFVNSLHPRRQQPQHSLPSTATPSSTPSASAIVVSETSGHHVLKIEGYSRTKMMLQRGQHVASGEFQVGGHTWRIKYYPNGCDQGSAGYISMHLECTMVATGVDVVHAKVKLSLPGHATEYFPLCAFTKDKCTFTKHDTSLSFDRFVKRSELESSSYLRDDCFNVRCDLAVFMNEVRVEPAVVVPPPALPRHLSQMLSYQEGSDVSFKVGRETFAAHRCILAARSPVFKAELVGPMKENKMRLVHIEDMDAAVFQALLHFIYTDELPTTTRKEATAMAQHLLVAADRYDMERLKLVCQDKLCRHLDAATAATTLALAEQHQYPRLKEAVFAFLCSSPANLRAVLASDGYEHLTASCPSITKELVARLAATL